MKTLLTTLFFLLFASVSQAQDTSLTAEVCQIHLHSGKKIDKVTLWKIDSVRVEYVKDGNLSDILTSDILRIESLNYRMEFDGKFKMTQKTYDLIITDYQDTIRGIIKKINSQSSISYIAAGKNNYPLKTSTFRSYVIRNTADDIEYYKAIENTNVIKDSTNLDDSTIQLNKEEKDRQSKKLRNQVIVAIIILNIFRFALLSY